VQQFSIYVAQDGIFEISLCSTAFIDSTLSIGDCDLVNFSASSNPDSAGVSPISGEIDATGMAYSFLSTDPLNIETYAFQYYTTAEPVPLDSVLNSGEPNDSAYGGPAQTLATLEVEGQFVYWIGTANNQPVYAPLVNATVRIWDSDSWCGDDELLGVTITDNTGRFSLAVSNGDCTGTADVYAQALLENSHVLVSDMTLQGGVVQYKFGTDVHEDAGAGSLDVGVYRIPGPGFNQRACLVFDHINRAWAGVLAAGYKMRPTRVWYGSYTSFLAYDDPDDTATYYSSPNIIIGEPLDANSFDVCAHEYGHAVMDWFEDNPDGSACQPAFLQWNLQ